MTATTDDSRNYLFQLCAELEKSADTLIGDIRAARSALPRRVQVAQDAIRDRQQAAIQAFEVAVTARSSAYAPILILREKLGLTTKDEPALAAKPNQAPLAVPSFVMPPLDTQPALSSQARGPRR